MGAVVDDRVVDEHLGAVLNEVLDAVYQTKQVAWAAATSPAGDHLRALLTYLIDSSGTLMEAERIDGRAPGIASPSSHQRGNIVADSDGDITAAIRVLLDRLDRLVSDVRDRAAAIAGATEAPMLAGFAEGISTRTAQLRTS